MRIAEHVVGTTMDLKASERDAVIEELVNLLVKKIKCSPELTEELVARLKEREDISTTGIGKKVAIPHTRCDEFENLAIVVGISQKGIEFNSLDNQPVSIFFLVIAPNDSDIQLKALARIALLLRSKTFKKELLAAQSGEELYDIIRREDEKF